MFYVMLHHITKFDMISFIEHSPRNIISKYVHLYFYVHIKLVNIIIEYELKIKCL